MDQFCIIQCEKNPEKTDLFDRYRFKFPQPFCRHTTPLPLVSIHWTQPGPVFCLLLEVSSDYAQPITAQVTEVTCPAIGGAQPELTLSMRQKTGPVLSCPVPVYFAASYCLSLFYFRTFVKDFLGILAIVSHYHLIWYGGLQHYFVTKI